MRVSQTVYTGSAQTPINRSRAVDARQGHLSKNELIKVLAVKFMLGERHFNTENDYFLLLFFFQLATLLFLCSQVL